MGLGDTRRHALPTAPERCVNAVEPITLSTERLLLRPLRPTDTDAVLAACQDPEIPRWTPVPSPYTLAHAVAFIDRNPEGWRNNTEYNFGVFTRESASGDGVLVGSMGLVNLGNLGAPGRQAELGYWTAREHRGKGYTAEAGREVCRWAFERLGVQRMEWIADAGNEGSRGVARKIGFVMEGTQRARIVHRGARKDAWTGALLPSDFGLESLTPYEPYTG